MNNTIWAATIAVGLVLVLAGAAELGFRRGRWIHARSESTETPQLATVQAAILGLLGLLLGFSFSAAASRFIDRHDLIVIEANAIGTAYLRADLLNDADRNQVRQLLREYTANRIEMFQARAPEKSEEIHKRAEALHGRLWKIAVAGVKHVPEHDNVVLPPVNEVIDLHSTRVAARSRHIPFFVLILLISCSALAIASVGYGCGLAGRRQALLTSTLAALIATTLWITIDLDYPQRGLIQLNQLPLENLQRSLQLDAAPA